MSPTDCQACRAAVAVNPLCSRSEGALPRLACPSSKYNESTFEKRSGSSRLKGLRFSARSLRRHKNRPEECSHPISRSNYASRPSTPPPPVTFVLPADDNFAVFTKTHPPSFEQRAVQAKSACDAYYRIPPRCIEKHPTSHQITSTCPSIPRFSWQSRASTVGILQLKYGDLEIGLSSAASQPVKKLKTFDLRPEHVASHSSCTTRSQRTKPSTEPRGGCNKWEVSISPPFPKSKHILLHPGRRTAMGEIHIPSGYASPARSEGSGHGGDHGIAKRAEEVPGLPSSNLQLPHSSRTAGINPSVDGAPQNLSGLVCNVYRTTGNEPPALVGASSTIIGDKLYVFGGRRLSHRRPHLTRRFYELDLVRRHWTRLETHGRPPSPRYFHTMCPLGDTKLVCYGGMAPVAHRSQDSTHRVGGSNPPDPGITVMSDVHIYDIPTQTWTFIPTTDAPAGRYAHCAAILPSSGVFSSATAPLDAIQHNPASSNPNQGSIGVTIDGRGGAEMVIVGGQDSASKYIESISVFNLRSLKWTTSTPLGKSCGAYRSVVTPLIGISASRIGPPDKSPQEALSSPPPRQDSRKTSTADEEDEAMTNTSGCAMLLYSNYNFLDVKLELQVRHPDGVMEEKHMRSITQMPPGLRFPNGGVVNNHLIISGTFLTSSKQEYALWALNLKTLVWSRVDVGLTSGASGGAGFSGVFSSGSWNRGIVWRKRNSFVVLGNRKRNLGEDYHHRRLNFTHFCVVELESFGLYDNPRNNTYRPVPPRSVPEPSLSSPTLGSQTLQHADFDQLSSFSCGTLAAEKLGMQAQQMREMCDMDFLAIGGERIPVNSHMVAWRWGPYFHHLIAESNSRARERAAAAAAAAATTATNSGDSYAPARPGLPQRYSSITLTPSLSSVYSSGSVVADSSNGALSDAASVNTAIHAPSVMSNQSTLTANTGNTTATLRPQAPFFSTHPITKYSRLLYFPHTLLTLRALTHYLYTGMLPPPSSRLCTPQILCSLLQIARPYRIDGLLEATIQRLHEILDARNTAAVFNAAAMAAGGGETTTFNGPPRPLQGNLARNQYSSPFGAIEEDGSEDNSARRSRDLPNQGLAVMHLTNGSGGGDGGARPTYADNALAIEQSDEGFLGGALHGGGGVVSGSRHPSFSDHRKSSVDANNVATAAAAAAAAAGTAAGRKSSDNDAFSNSSRSTSTTSMSDLEMVTTEGSQTLAGPSLEQEVWAGGEPSQVIGLQKRGLRGLMEGRKIRERDHGNSNNSNNGGSGGGFQQQRQQSQRQSSSAAGGESPLGAKRNSAPNNGNNMMTMVMENGASTSFPPPPAAASGSGSGAAPADT